jgi:hypothetical protein
VLRERAQLVLEDGTAFAGALLGFPKARRRGRLQHRDGRLNEQHRRANCSDQICKYCT